MKAGVLALLGSLLVAAPVAAQRGGGAAADTTGAGGAPSLQAIVAASRQDSDLRVVRQRFDADRAALARRYDIPLSPVLHARQRKFLEEWQTRLQELRPTDLNPQGRADLAELRDRIRAELEAVTAEERQFAAIGPLVPFARALQQLQERRRERLDIDPVEAAQTLHDALREVERLTASIRGASGGGGPPELRGITAATASQAASYITRDPPVSHPGFGAPPHVPTLQATIDSWYSFFAGYDPLFSWWARKPYEELSAALSAYARAIRQEWAVRTTTD